MINKYWSGKFLGLLQAGFIIFRVFFIRLIEYVSLFFWKLNLSKLGKGSMIQLGVVIRYPGNIFIGHRSNIGRKVIMNSEIKGSTLYIGDNTQINRNCTIDFSGCLEIGNNVTISEGVIIESHTHGHNPRSKPDKIKKVIEDNVWIGTQSIILPQVKTIGKGSIIAAGSIVTKNVKPNTIVGGNPATFIKNVPSDT